MNRVYKVIWSKAKHCYVVTSEIAKSHTKGESTGRGLKKLAAALLVAAALMGPNFAWAADTVSVEPASATAVGSATAVEVYTKEGADKALHDETAARIGADAKLVEAVNSGITLNNENVLQKNTTTIVNDDGKVTTERGDVTEMILNKGKDNQITLSEDGIKVGKNSTVIASEGVFAGGDTADAAKAALNANGSIKGANGKFTVDTNGLVTANGGVDTNSGDILTRGGKINAGSGDISGKDISASGDISGKDITGSGTVKGHAVTDGTARMEGGALTGVTTITAGGDVVSTGGKVQGTSVSDGTATLSGGSLNNAVDINASGTITGNNVVVKGKLTTNGLETDRITLGSETLNQTDINKGNVTSKVNDTVGAVEYTAESIFNKDGSSITARTDEGIVDSTGKSIVGAKEISQYLGNNAEPKSSDKNVTRNMVRNGDGTFSMEDKAVDEGKSSTVSQNAGERKVTVAEGTNTLTVTENLTGGIVSETDDGAGQKVTLTQGMDGTYKVETSGTSTEEIGGQKVENYKGGLDTNITGDETHDVSGAMTTTVEGQATENFKNGL
uniref:ESPR domain-containing protein n=1 Tax=uncultured Dialister sp. TaxID=278064 RepID=UPI0025857B01